MTSAWSCRHLRRSVPARKPPPTLSSFGAHSPPVLAKNLDVYARHPVPRSLLFDFVSPRVIPTAPTDSHPLMGRAGPADDREQVFVTAVSRSLTVGVLVGGIAAVVLGVLFARGILRPVGMLTAAARRMEHGDLGQRVPVTSHDEIGQLAHAFNGMADALERTEQLRRNMVADVANELRTPLTNLRGYLEALKDGVAEPRRETIDLLYEEALLLTTLVDDLQDLALSEAGGLTLRREPSDVTALLSASTLAL